MKKLYLLLLTAGLSMSALAQESFELGKPDDDNYRYLDGYHALKEYIDYSKYPNFKLGIGTTVDRFGPSRRSSKPVIMMATHAHGDIICAPSSKRQSL